MKMNLASGISARANEREKARADEAAREKICKMELADASAMAKKRRK